MTQYLIRLVLMASAFYFLFPSIPGVQFHGNFLHALGAGVLFAFLGWIFESLAIAISAMLAIVTFGMALVILIPAWLVGFWIIPAFILRNVADIMPGSLSFTGWEPALWGGLVMLFIGIATSGDLRKRTRKAPDSAAPAVASQ